MSNRPSETGLIIHPSFELRRDLIVFSFTERRLEDGKVTEGRLRVGRSTSRAWKRTSRTLEIGTRTYLIDPRYDSPPFLEDQWSRIDLEDFIKTRSAPRGCELYNDLRAAVERHVDLCERGAYVILAVWPVLTFVYPAFAAVPFLLLLGPKETGKSQTLDVLARLCRCGHKSRPTAASLGDMIESQRATWLIDQAHKLKWELGEILVDSYRAGASRTITDMDKRGKPHRFETFGPKAFAAHGNFDEDLLDRCIQITMAPATRHVEPILADDHRLDELRWELYRFTIKNYRQLLRNCGVRNRTELGSRLGLAARELELWWPFEALFEWLGVPEKDRAAALRFYGKSRPNTQARLPELYEELLRCLLPMANGADNTFKVRSDQLLAQLVNSGGYFTDVGTVGRRLRELSLVLSSGRVRVNNTRPTLWTIDAKRVRQLCHAWRISDDGDGE